MLPCPQRVFGDTSDLSFLMLRLTFDRAEVTGILNGWLSWPNAKLAVSRQSGFQIVAEKLSYVIDNLQLCSPAYTAVLII
jgi:hypothetical protein